MKKFILPLIAIAAFASCSKDNIIDENRQVIRFDAPFINNATKAIDPSYSDANPINEFQVWGTVKGTQNTVGLFATNGYGATVTRDGAGDGFPFACDETEYWLPSAEYNFYAIAGAGDKVTLTNGVPTAITRYTADGTTDLIYAQSASIKTTAAATPEDGSLNENGCVAFSFDHLLSKVKFTFTNGFPANSDVSLRVKNIAITNAISLANYTISSKTWTALNVASQSFGHGVAADATEVVDALAIEPNQSVTSNYERMLIPGNRSWTVQFDVEYLKQDINGKWQVVASESKKQATVTTTFTAGYSYNLTATITSQFKEITFTVDETAGINGFENGDVEDDDFLNE